MVFTDLLKMTVAIPAILPYFRARAFARLISQPFLASSLTRRLSESSGADLRAVALVYAISRSKSIQEVDV